MSKHSLVEFDGYCPVCRTATKFSAEHAWYRDHLLCANCGSIPRERAFALVLERMRPNWRTHSIHEAAPAGHYLSAMLKDNCPKYTATQFYPGHPLGEYVNGCRNENLEKQTFDDEVFDIVATLDVLEHVNRPDIACAEISRTLREGGVHLFTVPTYKELVVSQRRDEYNSDGTITHNDLPEYHGNPVSEQGSLVTFHYGYDLAENLHNWSGVDVEVVRFHDLRHGIIGDFTEVYVATKNHRNGGVADRGKQQFDHSPDIDSYCRSAANSLNVQSRVHEQDMIFQFLLNNPSFPSRVDAVNYYFSDGAKSALKVKDFFDKYSEPSDQGKLILEFAAGYGAVTRHAIRQLSPNVIHSCDIHRDAVEFLTNELGATSILSSNEPWNLELPAPYEFIFVLSFFSHMPNSTWGDWLKRLYSGLADKGVLLFTTHGEKSMKFFPEAVLDQNGYWFTSSSEQKDLDVAQYGQTITTKSYVQKQLAELDGAELLHYQEAGCWDHQDLYIVRRRSSTGTTLDVT
jgi:SAM-dependent methyltransferase